MELKEFGPPHTEGVPIWSLWLDHDLKLTIQFGGCQPERTHYSDYTIDL